MTPPSPRSVRLPWVDHLRTLVIVLVVNMHACVTYSHVGGWYILSEREPSLAAKVPSIVWQAHLQAFFMGLLFFLSGYFADGALRRRGARAFVRERWVRLGIPALLYMTVIHPFILYGLNPWNADFGSFGHFYRSFIFSGRVLGASGPLWFVLALLGFSIVLALLRRPAPARADAAAPTGAVVAAFALGLGLVTFAVRLAQPIGTSVFNFQLCFFPQYIVFFATGVVAARRGWLEALAASPLARRAGWFALAGGPPVLLALMFAGVRDGIESFAGGWRWQAFGYALWEQAAGVGLSLGLLAWFSRRFDHERPFGRWLADRSFGVYVLHAPVLIALMMLFRALPQEPYSLTLLLTVSGLGASYLLADLARRVPGLRRIL